MYRLGRRAFWSAAQRFSRRRTAAAAGLAVLLVVIAVAALYTSRPGRPGDSRSSGGHGFEGPGVAGACTGAALPQQLAAAVSEGASVIVATGTLSGQSARDPSSSAGAAPVLYGMTLHSVQTLRGPAVASGAAGWIPGPAAGTPPNPQNATLLAPGGRLFAIWWPGNRPTLQLVPIVGSDVVFTPYGCWDLTGLAPDNYQAATPLLTVPGNVKVIGTTLQAESGIYTVPLATIAQVTAAA
jgi:hypothetical protein